MTTTEQSVEQALAELRERFPGTTIQVDASAWHWRKDGDEAEAETDMKIAVGLELQATKIFHAPTLNEAMAQVRAWHAEQAKES